MHWDGWGILVQFWLCQVQLSLHLSYFHPFEQTTQAKETAHLWLIVVQIAFTQNNREKEQVYVTFSIISYLLGSRRTRCFLPFVLLQINSLKFSGSEIYLKVKVTIHSARKPLNVQFLACPHQDTHKSKIASSALEIECLELTKGQI